MFEHLEECTALLFFDLTKTRVKFWLRTTTCDCRRLGSNLSTAKTVDFGSRALGFVTHQKRSTSLIVLRFAAFYPLSLLANLVSDFSLINWDLIQHTGNLSRILLEERG